MDKKFLTFLMVISLQQFQVTLGQFNVVVNFTVDSITTTTATLNWEASVSDFTAITYTISVAPSGPAFSTTSGDGSVFSNAASTGITGLSPGTQYTITVTFEDDTDTQDIPLAAFNAVPASPTINPPDPITTDSAKATWAAADSSEQDIYVIELSSTTTDMGEVTAYPENILTEDFTGLASGHEYTLIIKAKSGKQESSPASLAFFTVPQAPLSVTVAAVDNANIQVTWMASKVAENKQDTFVITVGGSEASCTETPPIDGDSTTCTVAVSGVPGTLYSVEVKSKAGDQESAAASDTGNTKPLPPTIDTPSTTTTTAMVAWTAAASVQDKYIVDLVGTGTNKGEKADMEATSPHTFVGLASGYTYTVTIKAQSGTEVSADATDTFTTVPLPPNGVSVTVVNASTIRVTWTPSTDTDNRQDTFVIYVDGNAATCYETTIDGASTTCTVTVSGGPGTQYNVVVKSKAGDKESTAVSGSASTKPAQPTIDGVTDIDSATATLTWSPGSSTQNGYEYTLTAVSDSTKYTNNVTATSQMFTTLTPGESYTFTIVAISNDVRSDPASTSFTTIPLPPSINTQITPSTTSVTISWEPGSGSIQGTYIIELISTTTDAGEVSGEENMKTKTFSDLASGHQYTLTVKAKSDNQQSSEDTIIFVTVPVAATDIGFPNVSTTTIQISWAIPLSTNYDSIKLTLENLSDNDIAEVTETQSKDTGNTYQFTPLLPGHQYRVTVVVVSINVESATYQESQYTVPLPPAHVTVTAVNTQSILVVWTITTTSNSRQDKFVLYIEDTLQTCSETIGNISTSCTIDKSGEPAGTSYSVDVKSKAGPQESSAATGKGNTKPLQIGEISAATQSVNQLVLHAAKPSNSVMEEPGVTVSPASIDINTELESGGLYYVITIGGLTAGTNHDVTVTSISGSETGMSRIAIFSTKPAAPTSLIRKRATTSSIVVGWTAPQGGLESYRLVSGAVDTTVVSSVSEYELTGLTTAGAEHTVTLYAFANTLFSELVNNTFRIKPNPPQNIVFSSETSTSFTVTWDAPDGEVTGYDIEGVEKGVNDRTHTFSGKTQGTQFTITVISKADVLTSSEATATVVTLPDQPGAIKQGAITTSSAAFSWTAPTEGGVTGYRYTMVPRDTSESKGSSVVALSVSETGLYAGATYDIKVWSYFDTTVAGYTYQESAQSTDAVVTLVPLPPTGFTVTDKTTTSFKFAWTKPANTILKEYKYKIYKSGDTNILVETVAKELSELSKSGRDPGTVYTVEMWTEVDDASGGQVESEHKMTMVTMVPDPPTNLQETSKSRTTIAISWKAPTSGTFDSYNLTITDMVTSDITVISDIGSGTESDQQTGLSAGRSYKFSLVTVSGFEVSSPEEAIIETNSPQAPDLTILEVSPSSIACSWDVGANQVATSSQLRLLGINDQQLKTENFGSNTFEHTFDGLTPGQYYKVEVIITVDNGQSTPQTKNIVLTPLSVSNFMITTISETEVDLSWDIDTSSYQDEFVINNGDSTYTVTDDSESTKTHRISSLGAGRQYTFTIHAKVTHQNTPPKVSQDKSNTVTTFPLKVSSFFADVNNDNSVTLSWTPDTTSTQTSYTIRYESSSSGVPTSPSNPIEVDSGVEYIINNLYPGAKYTFYITTVSGTKESQEESNITERLYPLAPKSLTRTTTDIAMTVVWVAPDSVISSYKLEYTKKGVTEWTTISTAATDTMKVISGLVSGQNYTVRMFGISDNRESKASITEDATLVPVMTANMTEDVEGTSTNEVVISYNEETGNGVFDEYIFTINSDGRGDTTLTKLKSDTDRVVRFSGLTPGVLYTIIARTRSGEQLSSQKDIQVLTVPAKPMVTCSEVQSKQLTIALQRPIGGITRYIIECAGKNCEASRTISPSDGSTTSVTYQSLTPFNSYTFKVSVIHISGGFEKTGGTAMQTCSTFESAPGEVASFEIDVNGYDLTVTWTVPLVTNGLIRYYTLSYIGTKQGSMSQQGRQNLSDSQFQYTYIGLTAGYNYTYTILAGTTEDGAPKYVSHYFPILAPSVAAKYMNDPSAMKPKLLTGREPTETDFMVQLVNPFTDINGNIVSYSVIVATSDQKLEDTTLLKWSKAQAESFQSPYIAINECRDLFEAESDCHKVVTARRKREAEDTVDITIGGDQSCTPETTAYCNGKLSPNTNYYVLLRAYTETGLHADTPFSAPILTAPKDQTILIAVVCAVVAALIFIIVIVLVVILVRRKKRKSDGDPGTAMSHVSHKSSFKEPEITSIPVKIDKFDEHVTHMSADSDFRFAEEYEDLKQVGRDQSWSISELPVNRPKNRFTNILPYDHSRVKLLPTDDEEGSDYINANWMPGYNSKREFIVTQGALPATTDDFWRMMWEQNSRAIVMLTKCVERGREKCHHYWPVDSEPIFYGDLQVTVLNETKDPEWVITEFKLAKGEISRKVLHFHYTAWPDFDVPEKPQSLINFVRIVRGRVGIHGGPITVHCSAGVGRSGTYICIDRLLQVIQNTDVVDIYGIVYEMRRERCFMVQTERQYICIHQCLLCVIKGEDEDPENVYENGQVNPGFEDDGIVMD